jgi:hypothetical protein
VNVKNKLKFGATKVHVGDRRTRRGCKEILGEEKRRGR